MLEKRFNYIIILAFAILCALSVYSASRITFDFSFEVFFPKNDPDRIFYNEYSSNFEPDDNFLILGIENRPDIFEQDFLQEIEQFTEEAASLPHIIRAQSLANLKRPIFVAGNPIMLPMLNIPNPSKYPSDSARIMEDERLQGRFISNDAKSLAVVMTTDSVLDLKESQKLDEALLDLLEKYNFHEVHFAGRPHYQVLLAEKSRSEFITYTLISALLIVVALAFIFRKVLSVLIALISIIVSMILFMGFIGATGIPMDPLSILFPILIMVVGISDVIHIMSKYIEDAEGGMNKREALRKTVREIGMATFLTSVTTAIGFGSLATAAIPTIRHFGIFSAIGVFIAFITVILLTTALLALTNLRDIRREHNDKKFWKRIMSWFFIVTRKQRKTIVIVSIAILLLSLFGISRIRTDVHFENNFPRTDKVREDYRYLEQKFGGVRNYEIGLFAKEAALITDPEILQQIDTLEKFLSAREGINSVISPATIYKTLNQAYGADNPQTYFIPESEAQIDKYTAMADKYASRELNILISKDQKKGRISARMNDIGLKENQELGREVKSFVNTVLDTTQISARVTGTAFLLDKNIIYGRKYLFYGLALAFVIISIIMALLFKDFKMVMISLVPNIYPLIMAGGFIGFLGIELTGSVTVIFAIAFGISVDYAIHFLSKYKLELRKGKHMSSALRSTFLVTGKAISLTTVILFFGFVMLVTSTYPPTFYLGLILSITLVFAWAAGFFLIPVMLYAFYGGDRVD